MLVLNLVMSFTGIAAFTPLSDGKTSSFNETTAVLTIVFAFILVLVGPVLALFCWFFHYTMHTGTSPLTLCCPLPHHLLLSSPSGRTAPLHSCGSSSYSQHNASSGSSMLLVLEDSPGVCVCVSLSLSLTSHCNKDAASCCSEKSCCTATRFSATLFEIPLLLSRQQLSNYYLYHTSMFLIIIVALLACEYLIFLLVSAVFLSLIFPFSCRLLCYASSQLGYVIHWHCCVYTAIRWKNIFVQ